MENKKLNPTAASLLGFLHDGPMTGWELAAVADQKIGAFWNLTRSQVYREIHFLEDFGLITVGERGLRDKRQLTLTDKGREVFQDWLLNEPDEEIIRFPLLLSASFADHLPRGRIQEFVRVHMPAHQKQLAEYKKGYIDALKAGRSETSGECLTYSFGIRYEEMVLGWMEDILRVDSNG